MQATHPDTPTRGPKPRRKPIEQRPSVRRMAAALRHFRPQHNDERTAYLHAWVAATREALDEANRFLDEVAVAITETTDPAWLSRLGPQAERFDVSGFGYRAEAELRFVEGDKTEARHAIANAAWAENEAARSRMILDAYTAAMVSHATRKGPS